LAGLLLGYAATIRYGEALLVIPLVLVALFNLRPRERKSWVESATLIGCWLMPVALLLLTNRLTMGSWTGYDATGESTGFDRKYLAKNWDLLLRQLSGTGLFLVLPVGVLGLVHLFARNWRLAVVLWAWVLPGVLLSGSYYWAPENMGIAYARFFLTVFPPLALGAVWCMTALVPAGPHAERSFRWVIAPLAALILVLAAGAHNVWASLPMLAGDHRRALVVADAADKVVRDANVPAGSVIFGPREMLHHLQFVGDYRLYAGDEFDRRSISQFAASDPSGPSTLQPRRAAALYHLLKDKSDAQLAGVLRDLVNSRRDEGRRVFAIVPEGGDVPQRFTDRTFDRQDGRAFDTRTVLTWTEPVKPLGWASRRGGLDGYRGVADAEPLRWTLVEVIRSARPTPATATAPTTSSTTTPTTPKS
jgi:hypothetical protein